MKLLFEDLAKSHFTEERIRKFKDWVESANKARRTGSLDEEANQYDKAEEMITFYAFAPLELRDDKKEIFQEILRLANVKETVREPLSLDFERQFKPPEGYLKWLEKEVSFHPVKYIREQGKKHVSRGKRLEGNTHVDAVLEAKNLLILVEMKFTSDISFETKFSSNRNQLARTIDVGISEVKKSKNKKLVVLLCSPSALYHKRSRFYYYKIQEYSDNRVEEDIGWRDPRDIEENLLAVAWLPLERIIKIIYQDFDFTDIEEAERFFTERNLWIH